MMEINKEALDQILYEQGYPNEIVPINLDDTATSIKTNDLIYVMQYAKVKFSETSASREPAHSLSQCVVNRE